MRKGLITAALGLLVLVLLAANVQLVTGHDWWAWHWEKNTLNHYVFGSKRTQSLAAVSDWRGRVRDLRINTVSQHSDISVFDGNYGATGWWGLASIESYAFDWWHRWCWCRITHAHARFNLYYGGTAADVQGVQCQEVGHTYGLDHSNTGDCMGKGYYNAINVTGPHNASDINAKY